MSPPRSAALLAGAALVSFACASAVQPLDTTSELGRVDPESIDVEAAASLAADAAREFDRRPDADAVHRAEDLWIRSAIADPYSALAIIGAVQAQTWLGENLDDEQAQELAELITGMQDGEGGEEERTEVLRHQRWPVAIIPEADIPDHCHYFVAPGAVALLPGENRQYR